MGRKNQDSKSEEDIVNLIDKGRNLVKPNEEEKQELETIKKEIKNIIRKELSKENFHDVEILIEGSVGKGTWLPGDKDIDIFLAFPQYYETKEMMEKGKKIGKEVGKKSKSYNISYAQHPYVQINYKEHKAEIVPSHQVQNYKEVKTAVDRTPLHTKFINEQTSNVNLKNEIRLLKKFMKTINVYGSEKSVKGFSGYVSELLVIHYGDFLEVLKNAKDWKPNELIDPKDWLNSNEEEIRKAEQTIDRDEKKPMILLDPVDPGRNAAAILSWEKMAEFSIAAEKFLEDPEEKYFTELKVEKVSQNLDEVLEDKDTNILILTFKKPNLIKDTLIPQLEKTERSLSLNIEKEGFNIYDSASGITENLCYIFLELENKCRSKTQIREGPPFYMDGRKEFMDNYDRVWIEKERLMAEYEVNPNITDLVKELLSSNRIGTGRNIKDSLENSNIYLNDAKESNIKIKAIKFLKKNTRNLNRF